MNRTLLLIVLLGIWPVAFAKNESRYPEGNLEHIGDATFVIQATYRKHLPLSLGVGIDPTFTEQQKKIIQGAIKILMGRALTERIINCAFEYSSKDKPASKADFEKQLFSAISWLHVGEHYLPCFAFIARYWDDPKSVGIGYVDIFNDRDRPFPGYSNRHFLHIAINADFIGDGNDYAYRNDESYWAGVIAHEFLHNLGYRHPSGYPGSFIYEYGRCIQSNGIETMPLEGELFDKEVEKDL